MVRIFISYRRADSQKWADRIYPILVKAFGKDNVFKDVDSIGLSLNFRAVIERSVINSDVVLILIGPQWVTVSDASGRKRLDNPDDFVRLEVEMALRHQKMVIPVTVDGALMPSTSDIPTTLNDLPFLNGANLRGAPDFEEDMERLIENIRELTAGLPSTAPTSAMPRPRTIPWLWFAIGLLLVVVVVALVVFPRIGSAPPNGTPTNAGFSIETLIVQLSLTNTPTPSNTPTADAGATEGAQLQATLTHLAAQAQGARLTATADVSNRLATSQVEGTLGAVAGAATAVAIEITQAALAETATQQAIFATATSKSADIAGTLAAREATSTADAWTDTPTPTPIPTLSSGFTPITRNADWTPVEQDFDGVTMVLVPAGCFDMGSNEYVEEQPIHEQCFDAPFWIDKVEVTNGQFARFNGQAGRASNWSEENRPRERITWFEARAFCEDSRPGEVRLPTEREWEYAARGPDNLIYPWGNDFVADNVVYSSNSNNQTVAVGSRPAGASWVGALDMSGNVWEWVSSVNSDYPYDAADGREDFIRTNALSVLRGGSWYYANAADLRAPRRGPVLPVTGNSDFGFRCARSYE